MSKLTFQAGCVLLPNITNFRLQAQSDVVLQGQFLKKNLAKLTPQRQKDEHLCQSRLRTSIFVQEGLKCLFPGAHPGLSVPWQPSVESPYPAHAEGCPGPLVVQGVPIGQASLRPFSATHSFSYSCIPAEYAKLSYHFPDSTT